MFTTSLAPFARSIRLGAVLAAATFVVATAPHVAAAAANDKATSFVKDVKVVTGGDPGTPCPAGYTRNDQDLNQGSGGSYVFACVASTSNPSEAIQELYVNVWQSHLDNPNCMGSDQVVDGDLNDGVTNGLGFDHEGLNFCIHRAGTSGGSGQNVDPVARTTTYFPAHPTKRLTGLNFVAFTPGNLPQCVSNDCVDTGVGGFAYLEYAVTAAPYCQQYGTDSLPLFRPYQSQSDADMTADVPGDAQAFNLNAGSPTAAFIYACGRFQSFSPLTAEATTQPSNKPYTSGTWADQNVQVIFSCNGTVMGGQSFGEGANQMASSGIGCTDSAGQPVPAMTFGPINIDETPPTVALSGLQSTYALNQTVSIQCTATDQPGARGGTSGVTSACTGTNAPAYTFGGGHHDISVTATDVAGNVGSATASFDVQVTVSGLASLTDQLLSASDPPQTAEAVQLLNAITASPIRQASLIQQYQSFLTDEVSQGGFLGAGPSLQLLIGLSRNLPPSTGPFTVNDSDPTILYTGSGWHYYPNRPFGDLNNDVHGTTADGDSASLTFAGTGISFVTERSIDCGPVDVLIDGVLQTTVNAQGSIVHQVNQTLYSVWGLPPGQHTITITKRGNNWMLLDGFIVQTAGQTVNDTDASIQYNTDWSYFSGRPSSAADYQQDVHATTVNGSEVAYVFKGTAIAYITEKSADEGQVDVYLDGVFQQTVNPGANSNLHNQGGQVLFFKTGLSASGQHEIKLVKKSGTYMLVDAFSVAP